MLGRANTIKLLLKVVFSGLVKKFCANLLLVLLISDNSFNYILTVILIILIVHVHTSFILVLLTAEFHAFYQSARVDGVVASSVG